MRVIRAGWIVASAVAWSTVISCSSDSGGDAPAPAADAGIDTQSGPPDTGPPFVPAPVPAFPQMTDHGGPRISTLKVLSITFANDPMRADIDAFTDDFPTMKGYLDATLAEYGVTQFASGHAHLTKNAPASFSDEDMRTLVAGATTGAEPPLGPPDSSLVYTIFLPRGVQGANSASTYPDSNHAARLCVTSGGYHSSFKVGNTPVMYAIIPLCAPAASASFSKDPIPDIEALTSVTTHEWAEAATDPFGKVGASTMFGLDQDHGIWAVARSGADDDGSEVGDLCTLRDADYPLLSAANGKKYRVQRIWSNKEAKLGRHYCSPGGSDDTVFGSVPKATEKVAYTFSGETTYSLGVTIPIGQSKSVDLQLFSDRPTDAWTFEAVDDSIFDAIANGGAKLNADGSATLPNNTVLQPRLKFAFDPPTGKNADAVKMTITHLANDSRLGSPGASAYYLVSKLPSGTARYYVGIVGN